MPERLPYIVEPMTLADIDWVMGIERASFPLPWSARAYRYEITENKHSTMLVVRPAIGPAGPLKRLAHQALAHHLGLARLRPLLGYAGFWLLVDEAHICTIAVHPEWRGQGLGELLLLSLLDRAWELEALRATLEVRVSNRVALDLYQKYGFEIVSRRKRYYTDNNEDAYIMFTPPFETPEYQEDLNRCRSRLYARLRDRDTGASDRLKSMTSPAQDRQA